MTHLDKTDGSRLFTEALPAEIKSILADKTSLMGTEAATKIISMTPMRDSISNGHRSPLPATLAIFSGTRKPNCVVCHFGWVLRLLWNQTWVRKAVTARPQAFHLSEGLLVL